MTADVATAALSVGQSTQHGHKVVKVEIIPVVDVGTVTDWELRCMLLSQRRDVADQFVTISGDMACRGHNAAESALSLVIEKGEEALASTPHVLFAEPLGYTFRRELWPSGVDGEALVQIIETVTREKGLRLVR